MQKIELLENLISQVNQLSDRDFDTLDAIKKRAVMITKNCFGENSEYITAINRVRFTPIVFPCSEGTKYKSWCSGKKSLVNIFKTMIEEDKLFGNSANNIKAPNKPNNRVFIVHGHDDNAKNEVARFVEKLGLKAIILHEQINSGATIIEKFEKHASTSSFAIVLLTPDDIGYSINNESKKNHRARQNVILELGYFSGLLGRKNLCVLYKKPVEVPSDYLGVVYIELDIAGAWKITLAKEMKEVGLLLDMNNIFD